VIRP